MTAHSTDIRHRGVHPLKYVFYFPKYSVLTSQKIIMCLLYKALNLVHMKNFFAVLSV